MPCADIYNLEQRYFQESERELEGENLTPFKSDGDVKILNENRTFTSKFYFLT